MAVDYKALFEKMNRVDSNPSEKDLKELRNKKLGQFYKSVNDGTLEETGEKNPVGYNALMGDINKKISSTFNIAKPKKMSLTELSQDEEFSERADRFLLAAGKDENIFEYLRDAEYSLSSAIVRGNQADRWTDQQKEDYAYIKERFMNAEVKGFRENLGMMKDIGVDIIADPLNIIAAIGAGVAIAGTGGVAAPAVGGVLLGTAARTGTKALVKESLKQSALTAGVTAVEGGAWGGLHNFMLQDIEVDINMQDSIDMGQVGLTSAIGAIGGGILGGGISAGMKGKKGIHYLRFAEKEYKQGIDNIDININVDKSRQGTLFGDDGQPSIEPNVRKQINELSEIDEAIDEVIIDDVQLDSKQPPIIPITEKIINKADGVSNKAARASYFLLGKSTSQFLEYIDDVPLVADYLRKFRSDFDVGILKAGEKGLVKNKTANGVEQETEFTFGETMGRMFGTYQYGMQRILNPLQKYNFFGNVSFEQSQNLMLVLRDTRLTAEKITNSKTGKVTFKSNIDNYLDDGVIDIKLDGQSNKIKLENEDIEIFKQLRVLLNEGYDEASLLGLFQKNTTRKLGFLPRLYRYDILDKNRDEFELELIKAGHADPINDKSIHEFVIDITENGVTTPTKLKGNLAGDVGLDMEIFGKDFMADAGGDIVEARILKARVIVDGMLDQRFTPFELQSKNTSMASGFMQARRFNKLKDNDISKFLESDLEKVLGSYFTNLSQTMARKKMFGSTLGEWEAGTLKPILIQMRAAKDKNGNKKYTPSEVQDVGIRLTNMFKRATGLETFSNSPLRKNPMLSGIKDWALLSQQAALLPFATLSSVTEPLILLHRVGVTEGPQTLGSIGYALGKQSSSSFQRMLQTMKRSSGYIKDKATGQVEKSGGTRNIADLDDDVWAELYQTGLALDQAVMDRIEGLAGAGIEGGIAKKAQQIFFQTNFLTPWTKAVQLASFNTGKRIITNHAKKLATGKSAWGNITKSGNAKLREELSNLGINPDEAIRWYNNSLNSKGVFQHNLSKGINGKGGIISSKRAKGFNNDIFYQKNVLGGANRFTKEIILNPKAAEANRPDWFGMPAAQFLIQFAGYPTVFNNTILKKMVGDLSPVNRKQKGGIEYNSNFHHNAAKTLGTVALMTTVAHWGNEIRSNGNNSFNRETGERKPEGEILQAAIRRWGGFGPYDYISKFNNEQERGAGAPSALMKSLGGPIPQQFMDAIAYRKGFGEMIATSLPYYGLYDVIFGEGTKKDLRAKARGTYGKDKNNKKSKSIGYLGTGKKQTSYTPFAKGGIVKNVPNVTDEPDEMQSRVTGQPFNSTSEAAQDITDRELRGQMEGLGLREPFVIGGIAKALTKTIDNAASKRGKKLRKSYLDRSHLEKLDETVDERFVSLTMVKDLLEDKDITVTEAVDALKAGGYKQSVINKFIRPYKEIGLDL